MESLKSLKWNKLVTECLGVAVLCFTIISLVTTRATPQFVPVAIAFTVMVLVYAGGDVSGGHYNPAITAGAYLLGLIEGAEAGQYVVAQTLGGYLGALLGFGAYGVYFNVAPAPEITHWEVFGCESLYTMWLVFTVLSCINVPSLQKGGKIGNQYYGLSIGLAILTGACAIGGITGGYMNPALSVGIDLASIGLGFGHSGLYALYQLIGGAVAAQLYKVVYSQALGTDVVSPLAAKIIAECLGVAFLTMSAGLIILGASKTGAFAIAAALATIVYNLGPVSGAHVNPAVTASILFAGRNKISGDDAWKYVLAQLSGGLIGGLFYSLLSGGKSFPLAPVAGSNTFGVFTSEVLFTGVLCLVVLSCATAQAINKDMFGLLIGSCVTVGGFASGAMSGGCLNPAVGFGIMSSHAVDKGFTGSALGTWAGYAGAELVGAGLAAGAFINTHVSEYDSLKAK